MGTNETITLHKELGVNCRLTYCCRCGQECNELLMLGDNNTVWEHDCGQKILSNDRPPRCPKCKTSRGMKKTRELEQHERIPSSAPCDNCQKELDEWKAIVAQGGVYFRCRDCGLEGVIKPGETATKVREQSGIAAPDPVGLEITRAECRCGKDG